MKLKNFNRHKTCLKENSIKKPNMLSIKGGLLLKVNFRGAKQK